MKRKTIRLLLCLFMGMLSTLAFSQAKKTIMGEIKDSTGGGPLPGATIRVVGTKTAAVTDAAGKFRVEAAPGDNLLITSIGYQSKQVHVGDESVIAVSLNSSASSLEGVVVTALGIKQQKRSLGYATTTVSADEITKTAPTNFASALYGKVPGMKIATAPGGSTSGVSIQLRGLNSITGRTQPLIVMDGIPIHDGDFNNSNYWGDQRLRGNGLIDLNPDDIETITVLKGASAAALYGSEATNGVILITTKSGKGKKGFTVDFSSTFFQDRVAYLPDFQHERGTGFNPGYQIYSSDAEGFAHHTLNGTDYRTMVGGSLSFGPVFDGKPILSWDGVIRPYSAQKNNWADLFQHGNNTVNNLAFSNISENSSTRFSVTQQHYEGTSLGAANDKLVFSLNTIYKFGTKFRINLIANDIWQKVHNRPYSDDRLINNFTGMMSAFDNGAWYQNKYQTSLGYRYVTGSNPSLTPDENLTYGNYRGDLLDYMWNVKTSTLNEYNNRLIASTTAYWDIIKNVQLRGRIATDWTSDKSESKNASSIPLVYGYSGSYGISTNNYSILYADVLLTYSKKVSDDLELKVLGGYTADKESSYATSVSTRDGLTTENRFDLTSSSNPQYNSAGNRSFLTKDALIGTLNGNYKNYLFLEGTVRRDRTSTMNPSQNSFVYPSVNSSFVLSDVVKMPAFINFSKLRASWGIVGNYPGAYLANVAYSLGNLGNQGSGGSTLTSSVATDTYGNDLIKPEKKHEIEFGLAAGFLKNRLNLDVAYYHAKVVDMILPLQLAQSTGASHILTNIGTLQNAGVDLSINGTPVTNKNFTWETGINFNFNNNKIIKLTNGSSELIKADYDGNAAVLKSVVGQPIGDLYAHPIKTDSKGEPIVNDYGDGTLDYQIDATKLVKYGNTQPKAIGGFYNTISYKSFAMEIYTDFRLGGYVMPTGLNWMTGRGLTKESLTGMDKAHGGLSYYLDANGYGVSTSAAAGPNGEKVYNDGMLLKGNLPDGTPNAHIESSSVYYWYVYNWGGPQYSNSQYFKYIVKNSFWKVREITLSYNLPAKIASKLKATKLQVSVFGRNLFYLYRTIKNMDSEQLTTGLSWDSQVSNAGTNFTTRSFGASIRATF
ncbi:MAG: SusC/RagA family TonB-linked outer membrane protein [Ginsengibacter sp.]